MSAAITFLGAAGTLTGSKHQVEVNGRRLLVDCGLYQGLKELRLRNWDRLPVAPTSVGWVVLTHAHIDHTGYLPRLVNEGFRGAISATRATADLVKILLPDSGHLQEEEVAYHNRRGTSKHKPALPLYTAEQGLAAAERVTGVAYQAPLSLVEGVSVSFARAGHILGSAIVTVDVGTGRTGAGSSSPVISVAMPRRSCRIPHRSEKPTTSWSNQRTATGGTIASPSPTSSSESSPPRSPEVVPSSSPRLPSDGPRS